MIDKGIIYMYRQEFDQENEILMLEQMVMMMTVLLNYK